MRIFSGVKPSGDLHIGNYLGALKQFVELQQTNEGIFCVVDHHAITVPQEPEKLRQRTLDIACTYLALGIDPQRSIVFLQSFVPAHTELGWILNTLTPVGELQRMTQYKDAVEKGKPNFGGLLNYPTLMAADILLYRTEGVPVGEDQIQHIELTRSVAERFNNKYGEVFVLPKPIVIQETRRVMSLLDPTQKMSKSDDSPNASIGLTDSPDAIREKIAHAVTDSEREIRYDPVNKKAISNLIGIYSGFTGATTAETETKFSGRSYAEFKQSVAEVIIEGLAPFQSRYSAMKEDSDRIRAILQEGSERAASIANETLAKVKVAMGFLS